MPGDAGRAIGGQGGAFGASGRLVRADHDHAVGHCGGPFALSHSRAALPPVTIAAAQDTLSFTKLQFRHRMLSTVHNVAYRSDPMNAFFRHTFDIGRAAMYLALLSVLAACAAAPASNPPEQIIGGVPASQIVQGYGVVLDGAYTLPPVPPDYLLGVNRRALVPYRGDESPGTIEIDPHAKFLFLVLDGGLAMRYPIAVGREGRGISGTTTIQRKAEWPGWTPTANMLRSEPEVYGRYAGGVPGGLSSPLGARALYLYRGGRDTFYRIHGTNDLSSIGNDGSAGCIRMFNQDAIDLYDRVQLDTRVVIRTLDESIRIEGPALANRGIQLPPFYSDEYDTSDNPQRPPVPEAMINPDGTYSAAVLDLIARLESESYAAGTVFVPEGSATGMPVRFVDPMSAATLGGG